MQQLKLLEIDPGLVPFAEGIGARVEYYEEATGRILQGAALADFANAHLYYGFMPFEDGWVYREWAPNAKAMWLMGDFNGWDRSSCPLEKVGEESWEFRGIGFLPHGSKVRVLIDTGDEMLERVPLYVRRAVQNPETLEYDGVVWWPQGYQWQHEFRRDTGKAPMIYEAHVGIAGEEGKIATYVEFAEEVLPRIKALGYDTLQLMAVMEHPYYGSFGYQVSNFFAVSSRFGTPEDFKALVDRAHGMGIAVILDIVHAHAATNEVDGIGRFDGTHTQFFHEGARGVHPSWGTRLFDYGKSGVVHFLLSNLKYWLEEYRLDGFRFDGVTAMLYLDHWQGLSGPAGYGGYFTENTDKDGLAYLQMACELCHTLRPDSLLIAEEVSGLPGLCLPVAWGGVGFDARLAMGLPDLWANLNHTHQPDWDVEQLWHALTGRRPQEKVIAYCESHDQAIVGDKTLIFRLADSDMYWHMEKGDPNPRVKRAVALHKVFRFLTFTLGGEGYLNFMGNEFGHPEWIDLPGTHNGGSFLYARRQWSLSEDETLRYMGLRRFDEAMLALREVMLAPARLVRLDRPGGVMVYRKGGWQFAANLRPVGRAAVEAPHGARLAFHSEQEEFCGELKLEQDKAGRWLLPAQSVAAWRLA